MLENIWFESLPNYLYKKLEEYLKQSIHVNEL